MSIKKYYEVACDECGCAEHFAFEPVKQAREYGWIVTADGRHFDSKECYNKFKERTKND